MTTSHALLMVAELHDSGQIDKTATVHLCEDLAEMYDKLAGDMTAPEKMEKTANFLGNIIRGIPAFARQKVNPELARRDPGVYHALTKAYQAGNQDAMKSYPRMSMSMGSPWRTAAAVVGLAAAARALGEAAAIGTDKLRRRSLEREVGKSKVQIFDINPDLSDDKPMAEETFDELARFAPALAASPHVAANFVTIAMNRGGTGPKTMIDPQMAGQLLQAQKTYESVQEHLYPSQKRFGEGIKSDIGQVISTMLSGDLL